MQTYLVEGYDETAISVFKYLAMFLSVIGFFKTNFVTTTYFSAPNQAYKASQADYDLTDSLIKSLESVRDGFHSFVSGLNVISTFIPDGRHKQIDYSYQFVFSMFTGSIFLHASLLALTAKYLTTAVFLGVAAGDVLNSLLKMMVIGMVPDFLVTTVPLYLNYRRLYEIQHL